MATQYADFGTDFVISKVPGRISGIDNLIKKIIQRLQSPTGCLYWDPSYGLDVKQYINASINDGKIQEIQSAVRRQCESDERVLFAEVIVANPNATTLNITIKITTSPGPAFTFVISVDKLTIELLTVNQSV